MSQGVGTLQAARGRGKSLSEKGIWLVFNQPRVLRFFGRLLRRFPRIAAHLGGAVGRRDAVAALLRRGDSFSNTTHAPNLIAGSFVLGMDRGARYESDAKMLRSALQRIDAERGACATESQQLIQGWLEPGRGGNFDLVEHYLMPVIWAGLKESFGAAGDRVANGDVRALWDELRPIAGHLVLCPVATAATQQRAQQAADALHARVRQHRAAIAAEWGATDLDQVSRNAIGLAFIGHAVTVQAAAHAMNELLARPLELQRLAEQAQQLGDEAAAFPAYRRLLRDHLLELLRFRPVFPVLDRKVPRKTEYDLGNGRTQTAEAAGSVKAALISAMFDPGAVDRPDEYLPHRQWQHPEDRQMVFGYGDRICLGKDQAMELLITAFAELLRLPKLRRQAGSSIDYDGPFVASVPLAFGK